MTFQEAEQKYKELAEQHKTGALNDADFETQVNELRLQDAQGRWWQIGVQSGDWYVNDGQKWTKSRPPADTVPAAEPAPASEATTQEVPRPSMPLRQIFSSKPAGRGNGGLPMPVFIGIIVVVALIGAGVIFGGYWLLSGQGGTTARATTTPTRVAALPTLPLATQVPALPTPGVVQPITPTGAITATVPVTAPTNTRPPAPTRTPTRAVPATPAASATPAVPAGIYVTNLVPDPAQPGYNEPTGFRVTFFNNTGGPRVLQLRVKIFDINNLARSIGETRQATFDIRTSTADVVFDKTWSIGRGMCDLAAEVYFLDQDATGQLLPIPKTDGSRGAFGFKMPCP